MTQREFRAWIQFYIRWPFDDLHRFHRPAALVATSMGGAPIPDLIEFLQPQVADEMQADAAEQKAWLNFLY